MLTETKRVENHDRVVELLNSVERDGISDLLKWLEESDFFTAPASRAYHATVLLMMQTVIHCIIRGKP